LEYDTIILKYIKEKLSKYFGFFRLQNLNRGTMLKDDKGLEMPAMTVFTEGIRYLKCQVIQLCEERSYGLNVDEIHWVITVPAIWDDTAKQFMREAAINVCAFHL
jgi:hypothetical protein